MVKSGQGEVRITRIEQTQLRSEIIPLTEIESKENILTMCN